MSGPISNEDKFDDGFDEPDHPIPALGVIDVWAPKKSGGAVLLIIVASPLGGDRHSLERLRRKIDLYLDFTRSGEFLAEVKEPGPRNTFLIVKLHPESDAAVKELFRQTESRAAAHGVTLKVESLD